MANLNENPVWEDGVFQLEKTTPPLGGAPAFNGNTPIAGHANVQGLQLANRTSFLKQEQEAISDRFSENSAPNKTPIADSSGKINNSWFKNPQLSNVYNKSIIGKLPLRFQGFSEARAAAGGTVGDALYPQGHCYDSSGNVFIHCGGYTSNVIVWYTSALQFGGWFLVSLGGESIVIRELNGSKKLFKKGSTTNLLSYDITVMPTTGSSPSATDVGLTGVGLQMSYNKGRWLIEQFSVDVGVARSRTKWNIYDDNFNKTGDFYVSKNIVGWQLPESLNYRFVPKSQGVVLKDDKVIFGLGGSYIPEADGTPSPPVAALGLAVCNLDGSLDSYGAVNAGKMITRLNSLGYYAARTESEGVSLTADGQISQIVITVRPGDSLDTTDGILLIREMDQSGLDFSDIKETYAPFDIGRLSDKVFPRGVDGGFLHPYSFVPLTSLSDILDLIVDAQLPGISWYTSSVTITTITGINLPTSALVTVKNANNATMFIEVKQAGQQVENYFANKTTTWSASRIGFKGNALKLDSTTVGGTSTLSRISSAHHSGGNEVLCLQQSTTTNGNLLILGGGSTIFRAATAIQFFVTTDANGTTGTKAFEITNTSLRPGVDNTYSAGEPSFRYTTIYAATGTINTSDKEAKQDITNLSDAELRVANKCKSLIRSYRFKDAVLKKGNDARIHFGVIAQDVIQAFESEGLDPLRYGIVCRDEWADEPPIFEDGVEVRPAIHAGSRYGIRYEELFAFLITTL